MALASSLVAIDVGGTFTDLVAYLPAENRTITTKSLTTYDDFGRGIFDCISKLSLRLEEVSLIKHGTTLVINALIERKGARTCLLTTQGFRDVLEIGRGNRPLPFDLNYRRAPALIERKWRLEIDERVDSAGSILKSVEPGEIEAVAETLSEANVESVAISFLNSYANSSNERAVAELMRKLAPNIYVTTGTELSSEWHEYERTATAAANAYVGPLITRYLERLRDRFRAHKCPGPLMMMGSNGGMLTARQAMRTPLTLVESGPIGGCIGAAFLAREIGAGGAIAFDMGGTTAKCAVVENNAFAFQSTYYIGGYETGFPIRAPVLDIVEVGAGGGSIAWIDQQKRLHVGPHSAGSTPGPVCYGLGGTEPTVTDANLLLGRINANRFLGGEMKLEVASARKSMEQRLAIPLGYDSAAGVEQISAGLVRIAVTKMSGAIRDVTVRRGKDARDFALIAYGGGGPLHAVELARELDIQRVIIPPNPGSFSAVGMLLADLRSDKAATFFSPLSDQAVKDASVRCKGLESEILDQLREDLQTTQFTAGWRADLRYVGQSQSLSVAFEEKQTATEVEKIFVEEYVASFGHAHPKSSVEFVAVRVSVTVAMEHPDISTGAGCAESGLSNERRDIYSTIERGVVSAKVLQRNSLGIGAEVVGPATIEEFGSATFLDSGDRMVVGAFGELRIDCAVLAGEELP